MSGHNQYIQMSKMPILTYYGCWSNPTEANVVISSFVQSRQEIMNFFSTVIPTLAMKSSKA